MTSKQIKDILGPGDWKRIFKKGSGNFIIREFEDKKTNRRVLVDDLGNVLSNSGLLENLKPYLQDYGMPRGSEFNYNAMLANLQDIPNIECEYGPEPLFFDNREIVSLDDTMLVLVAGGDDQPSIELTIVWDAPHLTLRVVFFRKCDCWEKLPQKELIFLLSQ